MAPRSPLQKKNKKEGSDNYNKKPTPPPKISPAIGKKLTDGKNTITICQTTKRYSECLEVSVGRMKTLSERVQANII